MNDTETSKPATLSEIEELSALVESMKTQYQEIIKFTEPDDLEEVVDKVNQFNERGVENFQDRLISITNNIEQVDEKDFDKLSNYSGLVDGWQQRLYLHVAKIVAVNNKKAIRRASEGLVNQLSVFSIVLAVLTFMLNNVKLFS